jgi:hypothetical protein
MSDPPVRAVACPACNRPDGTLYRVISLDEDRLKFGYRCDRCAHEWAVMVRRPKPMFDPGRRKPEQ